jgi:hypothetical protein
VPDPLGAAPIVVAPKIGKETASNAAATNPHVVLDISPPSWAERLAASFERRATSGGDTSVFPTFLKADRPRPLSHAMSIELLNRRGTIEPAQQFHRRAKLRRNDDSRPRFAAIQL